MTGRDLDMAHEAVLVAVAALAADGTLPTPGLVGLLARPSLTTAEVMLAAGELAARELLRVGDDGEGSTCYAVTAAGADWAQSIVARGT